jgi:hypothetical protein
MKNNASDGIPALIVKTTLNVMLFRLRNGATEFAIMHIPISALGCLEIYLLLVHFIVRKKF